ncbi:MAG: SDR family NAD(P)-dependent oxidoreductase [Anaerolineae bacterium]
MIERVLVTGGAGFIGSHLVDALLRTGYHVRVFDNLEPQVHGALREMGRWPDYCNGGAEYVLGDVRDREHLGRVVSDVDIIFHEAAMVGVGQSMYQIERYVDVNTRGTAVLLDVLANSKHSVRKLIVASSMSIYGEGSYVCPTHGVVYPPLRSAAQLAARDWELRCRVYSGDGNGGGRQGLACQHPLRPVPTSETKPTSPNSTYAITKKDQEELCLAVGRAYQIPTVALRYFNVYGPRQSLSNPYTGVAAIFSARLLNGNPPLIFEDGLQSRDFVHVSDIVQANLLAMRSAEADYESFNVGSGQAVTIAEVARHLGTALGRQFEPTYTGKAREGDIRHCIPDISKAQTLLGYHPQVPFEEGMRELAAWVRNQQAEDQIEAATRELESRRLLQ